MKPLKLKARNGILFDVMKDLKNDNLIWVYWDWFDVGFGLNFRIGDSRRFFNLDFLFLHLEVWF